jgi:hypothetical protein
MKSFWMNWNTQVLRSPEDEGAGGASSYDGEGGSPAPEQPDRLAALENRLGSMAKILEDFSSNQTRQAAQSELQKFESTLTGRVTEGNTKIAAAETALAEAFDSGDGMAIARAQRVLSEAVSARDHAKLQLDNFALRKREEERRHGGSEGAAGRGQQQPGGNLDTTNLNAWKSRNSSWYGVDEKMTATAHAVSARIANAGAIPVGSPEYFAAIDREVKRVHPDRFNGTPNTAAGGAGGGASAGSPGRGRISQSTIDAWKRMGIDTNDAKTVERMLGHRAMLADKGILSAQPVMDRVK